MRKLLLFKGRVSWSISFVPGRSRLEVPLYPLRAHEEIRSQLGAGIVHLMVSGCIQLCNSHQDECSELEHWRA